MTEREAARLVYALAHLTSAANELETAADRLGDAPRPELEDKVAGLSCRVEVLRMAIIDEMCGCWP